MIILVAEDSMNQKKNKNDWEGAIERKMNAKTLVTPIEGKSYKCSNSNHAVYRYTKGELRLYPDHVIASSWDKNWRKFEVISCDGIPKGFPMTNYYDSYFLNRYIDEIFIITTHNSLAIAGKVWSPNQNYGLGTQFDDGIRGFNFDLYMSDGVNIETRHGEGWSYNPKDQIDDLISRLDLHRNEFIVIQLESKLNDKGNELLSTWFGSRLVKHFDSSLLLSEYLKEGKQVLIVADSNYNTGIEIHNTNDIISENEYEWKNRGGTPPMQYRRGPEHPNGGKRFMRQMNYFCCGLGDIVASYVVHDEERALGHIRTFESQSYTGGTVNTLMVDYYR